MAFKTAGVTEEDCARGKIGAHWHSQGAPRTTMPRSLHRTMRKAARRVAARFGIAKAELEGGVAKPRS